MHDNYQFSEKITERGADLLVESGAEESTTETVLRAMAAVEGVDESEMDPIYEHVDPVALENIVDHADSRDNAVGVRFTVEDYTVSVRQDRSVRVVEHA